MTIYARNDILSVGLSRSHGGCGKSHSRPVENGNPVKLWAFDECPVCERVLRADPHWSTTVSEMPETYDEKVTREDQEKRGQRDAATATSQALTQLSSLGDLPAVMAQLVALFNGGDLSKFQLPQVGIQKPSILSEYCPSGHEVQGGPRFCGECGIEMLRTRVIAGDTVIDEPSIVDEPSIEDAVPAEPDDAPPTTREYLDGLAFNELRDYARSIGAPTTRGREDQIRLVLKHLGTD